MADLLRDIRARLIEGGWSERKSGKSEVWEHPNGAIYPVGTTLRDAGRTRANSMAAIARLERVGNPLLLHRAQLAPVSMPPAPALEAPKKPKAKVLHVVKVPEPTPVRAEWFTWVKETREANNISPDDLAALMGEGTTGAMIRKTETGTRRFGPEEFTRWLAVFDVTVPAGMEVPMASEADLAKRRGHAQAKALGAAMHDTLAQTLVPMRKPTCDKTTGPCRCSKCAMGLTDWDGEGLPPTAPTIPEAATPIPEDPMPAEAPVLAPEVPSAREEAVAMVTKILSNPRLTDEEAHGLAKDLVAAATRTLLGL